MKKSREALDEMKRAERAARRRCLKKAKKWQRRGETHHNNIVKLCALEAAMDLEDLNDEDKTA